MPIVSVFYPNSDGSRFDHDYYRETHLPLVVARWKPAGLVEAPGYRGIAAAGGGTPPFHALALLHFPTEEAMNAALGGPDAPEVMGDIAKFTDVQPIIQVNEPY